MHARSRSGLRGGVASLLCSWVSFPARLRDELAICGEDRARAATSNQGIHEFAARGGAAAERTTAEWSCLRWLTRRMVPARQS